MEPTKQGGKGRWKLFAVIAVCAAPVIASYLTYYFIKPEGRTNYGTLIDPRVHPMPAMAATSLDGRPAGLPDYQGKWIMLMAAGGDCQEACKNKLFEMRQLRLTTGKERDRVERVWFITDDKPLETMVMREYEGTRLLRVSPEKLKSWLPVEAGTNIQDHLYMVDPLGNLMMRWPKDADPNKIKKDLSKLLRASSVG